MVTMLATLSFAGVSAFDTYAPTVMSDKDDYSPGEVAIITGYGWMQDSLVDIHLEETPAHTHHHGYHDTKVNKDGTWTISYQIEERHLGVAFKVVVDGKQSGYQAVTYFTDGEAQIKSVDKSTFSPVLNQSLAITGVNFGAGPIDMGIRIKKGSIQGELVWETDFTRVSSTGQVNGELEVSWDGKNNQSGASNGQFVPNGEYYILAVKKETNNKGVITYSETTRDAALYKKVVVQNQLQPSIDWATAGTVTYGTSLQGKLNAVARFNGAEVAGTYEYKQGTTVVTHSTILPFSSSAYPLSVTFTPSDASQYLGASETNSITVNKKELTVTADSKSKTYDGNTFSAFTSTITGFVNNETSSVISGSVTYSGEATTATDYRAVAYAVTPVVEGLSAVNYSFKPVYGELTISKAPTATVVNINDGTYNASAHGGSARVTGAGELDEAVTVFYVGIAPTVYASSTIAPTNAGTYTATATYSGGVNHLGSSDSKTFTIKKATVTLALDNLTHTYDGTEKAATAIATPVVEGVVVSGKGTNAGDYTVVASLNNPNYEASPVNGTLKIERAATTTIVTVADGPFTYTGSAITPASVTVTGPGLNLTPTPEYVNNVDAGTATASFYYLGGTNYLPSSDSKNFVIGKANATIVVKGQTVTYNGAAHAASGTASGVKNEDLTSLLNLGESFTNVPGGTANWSFTGNNNYNQANGSVEISINKADQVISWTAPGKIVYGTALGETELNASVTNGDGTLIYTPGAGTYLNAGANQTLSVTATATNNYNAATKIVTISVDKADAIIAVIGKTVTYDGNSYSATGTATGARGENLSNQLNFGESFTNVPGGTASWTFAGDANHKAANGTADIVINKAPTTTIVTVTGAPFTYTGSAITPATVSVTGAGGLNLTPIAEYTNNVNAGIATASYSYAGNNNYYSSSDSKTFGIGKASATIAVQGSTATYDGNAHGASGTAKGVKGEELAGLDLGTTFTNAPGGTASWRFTDVTGNYNDDQGEVAITIGKRPLTITANNREKYCGEGITFNGTEFSITNGSLVANDAVNSASISSNGAAASSPNAVNGYSININNAVGTGLSNYNIDYVPGKLTFAGVTIDASASSSPVAFGQPANLYAVISPNVKDVEVTFIVTDEGNGEMFRKTVPTNTAGIATTSVSGLTLGVYRVVAQVGSDCAISEAYIPVFDASGSFVTGGGWINSPEGALAADRTVVGKANFGFVSKYKKGSSQVDGNTEFQFSAGNLNFKSTMHESGSLVIAGGKATYRGTGTVNGQTGFKFTIVAIDGDTKGTPNADKFRIKIVDSKNQVVYDNGLGSAENGDEATLLGNHGTGGGSIVIHEAKEIAATPGGKKLETADQLEGLSSARFDNYPNAFSDRTTIRFAFDTEEQFALEVYDVRGSLIKKVATGKAEAGQVYEYELDARNLAEGVYFARLITGTKAQSIKMILKK